MTPEQFAYWLQGFAELNPQAPNAEQWQQIRDHLNLVFKKETPVRAERDLSDYIRRINDSQSSPSWPYIGPAITC